MNYKTANYISKISLWAYKTCSTRLLSV